MNFVIPENSNLLKKYIYFGAENIATHSNNLFLTCIFPDVMLASIKIFKIFMLIHSVQNYTQDCGPFDHYFKFFFKILV